MAEEYVCTLDAKTLEIAKKELHEDPKERMGAVETFRKWINDHPHIKCDTDTAYLLWFLRGAKFSQLIAREKLEKLLEAFDEFPHWFRDIDPTDEKILQFLKSGYVVPLGRDKQGRMIIMYRISCLDTVNLTKEAVAKGSFAFMFYYGMLADDAETNQVNGFSFFGDMTKFEMKHMTFFGIEESKKLKAKMQECMPGRFKGFHYYNVGTIFDTIMAIMAPFIKQKFKDRMILHGNNMENVYKALPMEIFPDEYLPDDYEGKSGGSYQQLIDKFVKEMTQPSIVARLKRMTSSAYGIDKTKKIDDEPQASFRRLNVD